MDQRVARAAGIALLTVSLGACAGGQAATVADKAGSQTLVLHLGVNDNTRAEDQAPGPKTFLESLGSLSGGRIQVDLAYDYQGGGADSESRLVQATAAGDIDGGWPSVRGFASAGIRALEAVEAPMTLTSYAAVKDLVSGPAAEEALARLRGTGLVGLGLAVGPLRRPFAADAPLLGLEDWKGATFRSFNSPVQDATVQALGGTPLHVGSDWTDQIASGQLRGAEFDIAQYATNGLTTEAPYVTANVVLWPKVFVFLMSQKRWDSLTDEQRSWIQAAAAAGTKASVDASYDETTVARTLCGAGVRFIDASPSQLADLHAAVAPVIAQLAADTVTAPLLSEIQAIAATHPEADVPDVPTSCARAATPSAAPSIPADVSALPSGTYRVQLTLADVKNAGNDNGAGITGTWTLKVGEGIYSISCQAVSDPGVDCGNVAANTAVVVEAGLVRGSGQTAYFVPDRQVETKLQGCPAASCFVGPAYWLDWTLSGSTLTFRNRGGMPPHLDNMSIKPWTRID